jgi:hypothetical protein
MSCHLGRLATAARCPQRRAETPFTAGPKRSPPQAAACVLAGASVAMEVLGISVAVRARGGQRAALSQAAAARESLAAHARARRKMCAFVAPATPASPPRSAPSRLAGVCYRRGDLARWRAAALEQRGVVSLGSPRVRPAPRLAARSRLLRALPQAQRRRRLRQRRGRACGGGVAVAAAAALRAQLQLDRFRRRGGCGAWRRAARARAAGARALLRAPRGAGGDAAGRDWPAARHRQEQELPALGR